MHELRWDENTFAFLRRTRILKSDNLLKNCSHELSIAIAHFGPLGTADNSSAISTHLKNQKINKCSQTTFLTIGMQASMRTSALCVSASSNIQQTLFPFKLKQQNYMQTFQTLTERSIFLDKVASMARVHISRQFASKTARVRQGSFRAKPLKLFLS